MPKQPAAVRATMPEIIQNQPETTAKPKRRKKNKESHNAVERHRKKKINAGIKRIGDLLPCSQALKQSKNMILGQAFRYITELKRQNDEMLLNGGDKVQAEEIKHLRKQVEDLRKESGHYIELLKANGINFLDDPTIHWKGKHRCAKVAKITPTHLMSKGIIVYSNENLACSASKMSASSNPVSHLDKQAVNALAVQPSCNVQMGSGQALRVPNGTQIKEITVTSTTPSHVPVATLIPAVSKPCLAVVEQYDVVAPVAPKLPPPGNFVTFRGTCPKLAVTAPSPQQTQPVKPTPTLAPPTSCIMPVQLQSLFSLSSLPQTMVSNTLVSDSSSLLQDNESMSRALQGNSTHLRTSAASSTQTTWTTLQLTGNMVQPVCRALAPEASNSGHNISQLSVCPVVANPQVHPVPLQVQTQVSMQLKSPKTTCIPLRPNPSQLLPTVLPCPQIPAVSQASLLCQTPVLLHQPPLVPQTGLITQSETSESQPTITSKPVPLSTQTHTDPSIQPKPQVHVLPPQHDPQPTMPSQPYAQPASVPQPQSAIPPPVQQALVPQTQATTQPVLQTVQVVQMNSDGTPVIRTSLSKNNPNVVILQQAGTCPAPQVIAEDVSNQAACQHIVIIQTPTMPPTQQTHKTNIVPSAAPSLAKQITTSSNPCPTAAQAKQLVHILPRPSAQVQTQAPPTINVNGQVYVLQSVKSADTGSSQVSQSATQIIQPSCEEPNTNVALNCLSALTSLSHSISQVSSQSLSEVSNQSNVQKQITLPSDTTVKSSLPKLVSGVSTFTKTVVAKSTPVTGAINILPKKTNVASVNQPKQMSIKRARPVKRKEPKRSTCRTAAKPANSTSSQSKVAQGHSSTVTDIQLRNSTSEDMTQKTITISTSMVSSVTSVCSTSTAICVSSHSKLSHSPANLAPNTVVTSIGDIKEAQNHSKGVDGTTPSNSKTVTSFNSVAPLKDSLVVHNSSVPVLTNNTELQKNESTVGVLSSQCSTLNIGGTSSTKSVKNDDASSAALISQVNLPASSCTGTKSSPTLVQNRTTLTSVNPSENNLKVSSVETTLLQPQSIPLCTSADPTKSLETESHLEKVPQVQTESTIDKAAETSQMQNTFALHSSSSACSDTPDLHQESRNLNTFNKLLKHSEVHMSGTTVSQIHAVSMKHSQTNSNKELRRDEHSAASTENISEPDSFLQKETVLPQEVPTMGSESYDSSLVANQQTDSPTAGVSSNRGFSVASLLPTGQNITASSNTFSSFSFTTEQAEILAMAARAIFEQDSPGRKSDSCSGENPSSTTANRWELPKAQQTSIIKERVTNQQLKQANQGDVTVSKTPSLVEVSGISTSGARLPINTAYSQSQASTLTSLNVNNLIRPSSVQSYPGSPNLGQQVSVSSPGGAAILVSQPSSQVTQNCSGQSHINEYTPLKSALMRTHIGPGISERHQKDIPKRSAQDDLVLPINKRSKPCPAVSISRIDVKAPEHVQAMSGQMPPNSSSVMTGNHSDGGGALFSGNTFMSTVLRPSEGHCVPQLAPHEQNQPSVLHLQQGHLQHGTPQSGQILGGSHYLKHQHHQEQQRHLYQLQHHLTQPDTQIHNFQSRTLLQDQNVHKKRVVRGGQAGPPVNLQKQHHLEKNAVQHQPPQQSQQHQQQAQQHQQQQQQSQQNQHQQQPQHQQQKTQQLQQQQQMQQQSTHSRHQHLQQQLQQQHFSRQEKNCEGPQAGTRAHQNNHLSQQDRQSGQDHGPMQRLMGSRTLEQQLTSQASNPVSRSSDLACTPSRQERHRLSSYSAEALIGKPSTAGDQRMGLHALQNARSSSQDQSEIHGYVDSSHGKNISHNPQARVVQEHSGAPDIQRISERLPFKTLGNGTQLNNFEVQVSRSGDMNSKSVAPAQRGPQQQTGFRMGSGSSGDGRSRATYGAHISAQGLQTGAGMSREQDSCHQGFMHSLLGPHLPEQTGHQRAAQGCPPVSIEYNCVPGVSSGELQAKVSSPNLHPTQSALPMHLGDNNKGHVSQVSGNLHGSSVRSVLPHPPTTPHSSSDSGRAQGSSRSLSAVSQRAHHIGPDPQSSKIRPVDRPRTGNLRPINTFEPEGPLSLPSGGGVLLGRPQTGGESRRRSIVRFTPDGAQVGSDSNLVSDQHITQNFGFPFIGEGGMNPPPPINANASFIPPVTQPSSSRTPALLPVEPQNTLPSFYPSYSPAAHPSIPNEIPIQYFSNQIFTSPSADKSSTAPLNNRFGSILSPPRPVGFAQPSYPLLTDITPMPIANSSGITPHLSNFNLTSLFPEIASAMPPDGSSMPMSPLMPLANTSSSDSNKQSNRPAHNISHILGHDGTSAV